MTDTIKTDSKHGNSCRLLCCVFRCTVLFPSVLSDVFTAMAAHTAKYRAGQLFEFIGTLLDPAFEEPGYPAH